MVFRKSKRIKRLMDAGMEIIFNEETLRIMDNLDGCPASPFCMGVELLDEPVLYVIGKDGTGRYVNAFDCELVTEAEPL